jgi:hypothetical protein
LIPILALTGCAARQERAAKKRIQTTCDSLIGCSEEKVVLCLGTPQTIQNIGKLKIYQYHKSYGTRTNKHGYASDSGYGLWGFGTADKTWEAYDKIEIFFKDGKVTSWKNSVKR